MRSGAFDPPAIPAELWVRADMTSALRRRDIRTLLELLRQWAGLSQTRIATATGIAQGRLSNYATGKHAVKSMTVWEQIADGLDMPDPARACLGLAPRNMATTPQPAQSPADDAEQHTEFVQRLARARSMDTTVIRALDSETDTIRLLDRRLGAPAVTTKLQAHIDHIEASLRYSLFPSQRQDLAAMLAAASALAGWQAIDMGRLPAAWQHYERATAAARESGDNAILAYACGEQAYVLADLGHHRDALALVQAAHDQNRALIPHQIQTWLHAAEGEMAAAAGEETTCRHALDQAAHEIGYGSSDQDLPYLALSPVHLARWRGNCLVTFGDSETANELTRALAAMDPSFTRAEAGVRCDLAAALHVQGEHDEAHRQLGRARELAHRTGSTRQRHRIRDLARRLGPAV